MSDVYQAKIEPEPATSTERSGDFVSIRGRTIPLYGLLSEASLQSEQLSALGKSFAVAKPFEHLVIDGLFNQTLLELVSEEFDAKSKKDWRKVKSDNELTYRSRQGDQLGAAAQIYFDLIHSGRFVDFLVRLTGIGGLIPDPSLQGGGLHEVRPGGWFGIHLDFTQQSTTMLDNELIMITYLNKHWDESFGGSLELWDAETKKCAIEIVPEFGRTVLFRQSNRSLHGLAKPVNTPDGRTRRSIAAYYYRNRAASTSKAENNETAFFEVTRKSGPRTILKQILPPFVLDTLKHFKNRY